MSAVTLSPVELVFSDGESAMTDSLKVSKAFNKKHYNVIRDIENLECSHDFAKLNFEVCPYLDAPLNAILRRLNTVAHF